MNNFVEDNDFNNEELKDYFMIYMFDKLYNCLSNIKEDYKVNGFGNQVQFLNFIEIIMNSLDFYKINDDDDELSDNTEEDEDIYLRDKDFDLIN
jgi:hypothetical protein